MKLAHIIVFIASGIGSCEQPGSRTTLTEPVPIDSIENLYENDHSGFSDSLINSGRSLHINTGNASSEEIVRFAESLIGTPYRYASSDPGRGFDCSGFISYVFRRFSIDVPRSSAGFTHVQREIPLRNARRGDIILFTGTDSTRREVGHMGIITTSEDGHRFIHSTSGKANGVTVTPLNRYYQGRFVKALRIFDR